MIIKINGRVVEQDTSKLTKQKVSSKTFTWSVETNLYSKDSNTSHVATTDQKITLKERLEKFRNSLRHSLNPALFATNLLAGVPLYTLANNYNVMTTPEPTTALATNPAIAPMYATAATTTATATSINMPVLLQPIISMLQDLALPVGIGMAIWGLIELIIGNPGGREKIKHALLGYVGVFIIPFFFYQIRLGCAALGVPGV